MAYCKENNPHYKQYLKNKSFLGCVAFSKCDFYLDWAITVLFYCVIHLVEMKFSEIKVPQSNSHFDRRNEVLKNNAFENIRREYVKLEQASRKYRYECPVPPARYYYVHLYQLFLKVEKELFN